MKIRTSSVQEDHNINIHDGNHAIYLDVFHKYLVSNWFFNKDTYLIDVTKIMIHDLYTHKVFYTNNMVSSDHPITIPIIVEDITVSEKDFQKIKEEYESRTKPR